MVKRLNGLAVLGSQHHNSDFGAPPATPGEQGPTRRVQVKTSAIKAQTVQGFGMFGPEL